MSALLKMITLLLVGYSLLFLASPKALAAPFDVLKDPCDKAPQSAACKDTTTGRGDSVANNVILRNINAAANIVAVVTGVVAVVMVMVGGFSYITSSGNAEKTATARRRIVYSLIGLAIVVLAWTITRFIIDRVVQ